MVATEHAGPEGGWCAPQVAPTCKCGVSAAIFVRAPSQPTESCATCWRAAASLLLWRGTGG